MKVILVDAIGALVIEDEGIYEPLHQLLESYPNRKIVLTGANDEQFKAFGLYKVPYEIFTLKHDPEKTDPAYFHTLLKHFGLTKDDVVYFEHNMDAAKTAESVGIPTQYYDDDERDLVGLKQFLDDNLA